MEYEKRNYVIANSYYNIGLERARLRDLSGAAECLKKSLHFNKHMTDARNLLGLIYYEAGEVGDALVQWVISMNLQPENNRADYYLSKIQRKKGIMDYENRMVRHFNQALSHAQNGSKELAILQLNKIVEEKPSYVKAQLLFAVLNIERGNYKKASKAVNKALEIDRNNRKAIYYKSLLKGEGELSPAEEKKAECYKRGKDNGSMTPSGYRENTKDHAILNILVGILLGAAVIFFMVMPAKTKAMKEAHNKEILKYSEEISQVNQTVDSLEEQMETLTKDKQTAEDSLSFLTSHEDSILAQYQGVIGILDAYKKNDFSTVVKLYAGLDASLIPAGDVQAILEEIKKDVAENGIALLEGLGDQAMAAGDASASLVYYSKCFELQPASWQAKYKAAVIYKGMDQKDQANGLLADVINNSNDPQLMEQAKAERGF